MKKVIFTLTISLLVNIAFTQDFRFGKVSKEELEEKVCSIDSSANAAVLYKDRNTYYSYTENTGWELLTEVHERIKIYNKEGYEWATKKIDLYVEDEEERVTVKAFTFNLEDGKVEKEKLNSKEIFYDETNKYWTEARFTMPNLKEGCLVEWNYTIRSPYYWHINDVQLQYKIPAKKIDVRVKVPEFFVFKNQTKGYIPFKFEKKREQESLTFLNVERTDGSVTRATYNQDKVTFFVNISELSIDNVPALIEEPYVDNIDNYLGTLMYELTAYTPKYAPHKYFNTTWEDVTETIYKSSNFGKELDVTSHFKDDLDALVGSDGDFNSRIFKIFQFVKSKIKWDGYYGKYTSNGVRKAYKEGVGNASEINLTLISMLRKAGLTANPVLISTRDHGIPMFPTTEGFNFVIAGIENNGNVLLLDATDEFSLPGILPLRDLNWQGRVVRENGSSAWVNLNGNNSSILNSILNINIGEEGEIEGMSRVQYDNLMALEYRNKYAKVKDEDIKTKTEESNQGIEISEFKLDNKVDITKPVIELFKFNSEELTDVISDKIYFKPLFFNSLDENPFKRNERQFPIDFGTPFVQKNMVSITIPEGYTVESLPENIAIGLPNKYGMYKYEIKTSGNKIDVYAILQITTPVYPTELYSAIKEFYKQIVSKNLEQVVLVKA